MIVPVQQLARLRQNSSTCQATTQQSQQIEAKSSMQCKSARISMTLRRRQNREKTGRSWWRCCEGNSMSAAHESFELSLHQPWQSRDRSVLGSE